MIEQSIEAPRRRTIGVLGGMGPAATIDFYRRIVDATPATRDQDHLHVLIDSDPAVPDRTAFLLGQGADPTPALIAMARRLEGAGADLLVIACNAANAFVPRVAAAVRVPVLHWIDEVAAGIAASEPAVRTVGLLATSGTVAAGHYARAFARHGIAVAAPGAPAQERVMAAIYGPGGVKAGATELCAARAHAEYGAYDTIEAGAELILLACTELSLLFATHRPAWPVRTVDAAQVVAERLVALAGGWTQVRQGRHGIHRSGDAQSGAPPAAWVDAAEPCVSWS